MRAVGAAVAAMAQMVAVAMAMGSGAWGAPAGSRFPQPVRAGDLAGRAVLEPIEAQTMLGRVRGVVRDAAGSTLVVIDLRRWFGLERRTVALALDAVVLLGDAVEPVDPVPAHLWQRPSFDLSSATPLGEDAVVRIGLARPSH